MTCASTAKNGDVILTIRIPEKEDEDDTVDTSKLDFLPNALDRVRMQDPFLYYSIQNEMRRQDTDSVPAVHRKNPISSQSSEISRCQVLLRPPVFKPSQEKVCFGAHLPFCSFRSTSGFLRT